MEEEEIEAEEEEAEDMVEEEVTDHDRKETLRITTTHYAQIVALPVRFHSSQQKDEQYTVMTATENVRLSKNSFSQFLFFFF